MLQVFSPGGALRAPALRPSTEKFRKHVPETALSFGAEIHAGKVEAALGSPTKSSPLRTGLFLEVFGVETVLIVHASLLGITQHIIGLLDSLEPLLGGFVSGIYVGVIFSRQAPVCLFDLRLLSVPRDTQNGVIIFFLGHRIH